MINDNELLNELKEISTSEKETEELFLLSKKLSQFSHLKRSEKTKKSFLEKLKENNKSKTNFAFPRIFVPILTFIILLFTGFVTVASAQKSLPGDTLYPVKRLSEKVIVKLQPEIKSEILLRRSEEIKKITEKKKDSNVIKKTLKKYEEEIEKNKNEGFNNIKIKESKKNLEEAKNNSSKENKIEIERVIEKIGSKELKNEQKEVKGIKEKKINEL